MDYQCSSSTGRADDKSGGEEGEFGGKGAIPPEKIVPVHGSMARLLCESCGAEWTSTFTFTPAGGGTDVHLEMRTRPITFMAKLMSPLSFLFAGAMKKCVRGDMNDLQALCEQPAGAPA